MTPPCIKNYNSVLGFAPRLCEWMQLVQGTVRPFRLEVDEKLITDESCQWNSPIVLHDSGFLVEVPHHVRTFIAGKFWLGCRLRDATVVVVLTTSETPRLTKAQSVVSSLVLNSSPLMPQPMSSPAMQAGVSVKVENPVRNKVGTSGVSETQHSVPQTALTGPDSPESATMPPSSISDKIATRIHGKCTVNISSNFAEALALKPGPYRVAVSLEGNVQNYLFDISTSPAGQTKGLTGYISKAMQSVLLNYYLRGWQMYEDRTLLLVASYRNSKKMTLQECLTSPGKEHNQRQSPRLSGDSLSAHDPPCMAAILRSLSSSQTSSPASQPLINDASFDQLHAPPASTSDSKDGDCPLAAMGAKRPAALLSSDVNGGGECVNANKRVVTSESSHHHAFPSPSCADDPPDADGSTESVEVDTPLVRQTNGLVELPNGRHAGPLSRPTTVSASNGMTAKLLSSSRIVWSSSRRPSKSRRRLQIVRTNMPALHSVSVKHLSITQLVNKSPEFCHRSHTAEEIVTPRQAANFPQTPQPWILSHSLSQARCEVDAVNPFLGLDNRKTLLGDSVSPSISAAMIFPRSEDHNSANSSLPSNPCHGSACETLIQAPTTTNLRAAKPEPLTHNANMSAAEAAPLPPDANNAVTTKVAQAAAATVPATSTGAAPAAPAAPVTASTVTSSEAAAAASGAAVGVDVTGGIGGRTAAVPKGNVISNTTMQTSRCCLIHSPDADITAVPTPVQIPIIPLPESALEDCHRRQRRTLHLAVNKVLMRLNSPPDSVTEVRRAMRHMSQDDICSFLDTTYQYLCDMYVADDVAAMQVVMNEIIEGI